jgi:hypothetical protein
MAGRMINLVRSKLLCQVDIDVAHDGLVKPNGRIAVVDVRLMLDYGPRCEATRSLEAELVATHMRVAYSVPKSREYIHSGYPSEPLLAEAAAQQMRCFREKDPDAVIQILKQTLGQQLLDKGGRGELVARSLLVSAYDRAVERDQDKPLSTSAVVHYSAGVSLITFIEELFTPRYAKDVLDGKPVNVSSKKTFRTAFKNAMVRFTHFGKMDDILSTHDVAAALVRSMAIICQTGEKSVDMILPVLLNKEWQICEAAVTGILVQVKRRAAKGSKNAYEIQQQHIGFFPQGSIARPYISLVMELGVQNAIPTKPKTGKTKPTRAARNSKSTKDPVQATPSKLDVRQQGRCVHPSDPHPRYSIFAYGCSETVYKGILRTQRDAYQHLLGTRSFLVDHPRQDDATLDAIRQLKPFWSSGLPSYQWWNDNVLHCAHDYAETSGLTTGAGFLQTPDDPPWGHDVLPEPIAEVDNHGSPLSPTPSSQIASTSRAGKRQSDEAMNLRRPKRGKSDVIARATVEAGHDERRAPRKRLISQTSRAGKGA